jgi:O-methyltransferase
VGLFEERLRAWRDSLVFHAGDVFDTLREDEVGDLSLVHMDLNASAPTRIALEYAYPRLVAGGVIVFDDYGWDPSGFEQRDVIEEFCQTLTENPIALPSGQALLIKLH